MKRLPACLAILFLLYAAALAESLPEFFVETEELPEGGFALHVRDMTLAFQPIDIRYCLTRESGRYMFGNMGYDRETLLPSMEENHVYAMLYNKNRRAVVQVHVYPYNGNQEFAAMDKQMVQRIEEARVASLGWTVHACDILEADRLVFCRMLVSAPKSEGGVEWRLIYISRHSGIEMEVQAIATGKRIIEMVMSETDEFVRNIRCTYDEE